MNLCCRKREGVPIPTLTILWFYAQAWYRCLITIYQYSTIIYNYSELFGNCALLKSSKKTPASLTSAGSTGPCSFIKQGIVTSLILNVLIYVVMCFSRISKASGIFVNVYIDLGSIFSIIYKGNSVLLPL